MVEVSANAPRILVEFPIQVNKSQYPKWLSEVFGDFINLAGLPPFLPILKCNKLVCPTALRTTVCVLPQLTITEYVTQPARRFDSSTQFQFCMSPL